VNQEGDVGCRLGLGYGKRGERKEGGHKYREREEMG